jgi:hypothetical protein
VARCRATDIRAKSRSPSVKDFKKETDGSPGPSVGSALLQFRRSGSIFFGPYLDQLFKNRLIIFSQRDQPILLVAQTYLLRLSMILFASSKTASSAAWRLENLPHMLKVPKYPCIGLNFALASMKSPLSLVETSIS